MLLMRTMFELTVRSMDGNCRNVTAGPEMSVATFRAELEEARALPPFHDVKIFHGAQWRAGAPGYR